MNNLINTNRESLQSFIKKQTLGPGINDFYYIDSRDSSEQADEQIEILNEPPAQLYSTGILFPREINDGDNNVIEENDENELINDSHVTELNQMFPTTMGLSFCISQEYFESESLSFELTARQYSKIKTRDIHNIYHRCSVQSSILQDYLAENEIYHLFAIEEIDRTVYVKLKKSTLDNDDISHIREKQDEKEQDFCNVLLNKIENRGISKNKSFRSHRNSYQILKKYVYSVLKDTINEEDKKWLLSIGTSIEKQEACKIQISKLVNPYIPRKNGHISLWKSKNFNSTVTISGLKPENLRKKTILSGESEINSDIRIDINGRNDINGLKKIFCSEDDLASLSVILQFTKEKANNNIFVKLQLVNTSEPFKKESFSDSYFSVANSTVNRRSFFDVNIKVPDTAIQPYNHLIDDTCLNNEGITEEQATAFVYRQFKDYGVGHGCSVQWSKKGSKIELQTTYIPTYDLPDVDAEPRNKEKSLVEVIDNDDNYFTFPAFNKKSNFQNFKWLSTLSKASDKEVINGLIEFVQSYGDWIDIKRNKQYESQEEKLVQEQLEQCTKDFKRMKSNISCFLMGDKNAKNIESFRVMNTAMYMQLFHSVGGQNGKIKESIKANSFKSFNFEFYRQTDGAHFNWRAFQLAFILINLDGIFKNEEDSKWTKRNELVDLVWFPTGGGKTEAYLGIIALTIINRRKLYKENGGGVAAIMRYTLRLLTMQQFQRATLMISALENIRQWKEYNLGQEPITIGLWVGKGSMPNSLSDLKKEARKLKDGEGNKIPFKDCPWCGGDLIADERPNKKDIFNDEKVLFFCKSVKCTFNKKPGTRSIAIPINLCDESIYRHPPTLLFGTVDKFAQLAHKVGETDDQRKSDSRRLFGQGNWEQGKPSEGYLPPDLIIQDEMHLLVGPLGSAVALYETAIDKLCTRKDGTKPKIISSTATTRNTQLQVAALFGKEVNLFPKAGVECDDSFFSFYRRKSPDEYTENVSYQSKRRYLGIMPTGRTQTWMQMRISAITLAHRIVFESNQLKQLKEENNYHDDLIDAIDSYYTIVSYFNSLKDVGKTEAQIHTYLKKDIVRILNRVYSPHDFLGLFYNNEVEYRELTGRLTGEEVKKNLQLVEEKWSPQKRFNNSNRTQNKSIDYVIATNMISVGIDVSRFNTIIMNSMPRNTAEYIQASSRVARKNKGLVITIHNPFQARDVSHFERFCEFHSKMYSYVEPISITPFTKKAIDRYLGLYMATLLRHLFPSFASNSKARDIPTKSEKANITNELAKYLNEKAKSINKLNSEFDFHISEKEMRGAKEWIDLALEDWESFVLDNKDNEKPIVYKNNNYWQSDMASLYVDIQAAKEETHSEKWRIPMSLRSIEPETSIRIIE